METICLIGKPNVGKSTIFNRLIKERKSIILDTPGVTRDRLYGISTYKDKTFRVIDTGGITFDEDKLNENILVQASIAIDEADVILFIVDGKVGIDSTDIYIKDLLHKTKKDIYLVINKVDNPKREENIYDFYELGFDKMYPVSAEHNLGFEKLLDDITKNMKEIEPKESKNISFSFLGRPNVGKSSLVNALLNEERVLINKEAGTTRDTVDTTFKYNNEEYIVIDTAGMRKKGKIYSDIEKYSLIRSLKAIDRSDVCLLVINAEEGIIEHDKHIASYIIDSGKPIVIVVNKWDLISDKDVEMKRWTELIRDEFKFVPYANIVFLSALTKKRMHTLMPEILSAYESSKEEVKSSFINKIIQEAYFMHPSPTFRGKRLKIYFVHQSGIKPPKFTFEVNDKSLIHFSYKRYLENQIREQIPFRGTPIILHFKNKNEKEYE